MSELVVNKQWGKWSCDGKILSKDGISFIFCFSSGFSLVNLFKHFSISARRKWRSSVMCDFILAFFGIMLNCSFAHAFTRFAPHKQKIADRLSIQLTDSAKKQHSIAENKNRLKQVWNLKLLKINERQLASLTCDNRTRIQTKME